MYGNFEQNIDIGDVDFEAFLDFRTSTDSDQNWKTQYPYQTIKSRRTYQVGLVLADKYGRQTPVIITTRSKKINSFCAGFYRRCKNKLDG